jgi:hypothetical protein
MEEELTLREKLEDKRNLFKIITPYLDDEYFGKLKKYKC